MVSCGRVVIGVIRFGYVEEYWYFIGFCGEEWILIWGYGVL